MQPQHFQQIRDQLTEMRRHREAFRNAGTVEEARRHWGAFLVAFQRAYNKLCGSTSGAAKQWVGKKLKERRDDELLKYLHHARNADEHGLEEIAVAAPEIAMIYPDRQEGWIRSIGLDAKGRLVIEGESATGGPLRTEDMVVINRLKLVRVRDRGVDFDPPKRHIDASRGVDWDVTNFPPLAICDAAIDYMDHMTAHVARWVIHPVAPSNTGT